MTELLDASQAAAARACSSCPKMCRSACPTQAVTGNERHQPWGHAAQVVEALRYDDGFVDPELVDGVYACATCSACTPPCHVDGVETPLLVWAARAAVHRAGGTPTVGLDAVRQAQAGRVPGATPELWSDPAETLAALRAMATPGAALVLFPGCGALGRRPGAVLAAGRVLRALGVDFDVPAEHRCCGMPALTFGDEEAATAMRAQALNGAHGRSLAVQSPSCSYWLAHADGPDGPAVEPLAATLARALQERPAAAAEGPRPRAAYHDPCYLARHQRVREQPRAALAAAGYRVAELSRHGDRTQCSGQGGGLPATHPDIAAGYLRLLAAQTTELNPDDQVVTGCASCAAALHTAGVNALELAEAIAAALGVEEEPTR